MDIVAERQLNDLVLLDTIDDDVVAGTLKSRFLTKGLMYTYSGPVLIAVNPYKILSTTRGGKAVSIYDESMIDAYRGTSYFEVCVVSRVLWGITSCRAARLLTPSISSHQPFNYRCTVDPRGP